MKPPRFDLRAVEEFQEAVNHYEGHQVGLGAEFARCVWIAIERLGRSPEMFEVARRPAVRRCRVERFPYDVVFAEMSSHLLIIAVAHHHRRPQYWRKRTPGSS